jgi:hypothetical protein
MLASCLAIISVAGKSDKKASFTQENWQKNL